MVLRAFYLALMIFLPLSVSACGDGNMTPDGYENATLEHAYEHWQAADKSPAPFVFLDVRTSEEFAAGHVPGAINIPVQQLQQRLADIPKNKRVYVHCESGIRSSHAAKMLVLAGFKNIENIPAGMRGWRNANYPIEK